MCEREVDKLMGTVNVIVFFFFKQKTAYEIKECDWSSDVCSSDLVNPHGMEVEGQRKD